LFEPLCLSRFVYIYSVTAVHRKKLTASALLVEPDWLHEHLKEPKVRILDCTTHMIAQPVGPSRIKSGLPDFNSGHIPGALHVDMVDDLSDPKGVFPYTMPSAKQFESVMQRLGIHETDHVVLYGDSAMMTITRAWLVFVVNGHPNTSILNGNLATWRQAGFPVSSEVLRYPKSNYRGKHRLEQHITNLVKVRQAMTDRSHTLINALNPEQFTGSGGAHYGRPGRIPTSVNLPARSLVNAQAGRFKSISELQECVRLAGIADGRPTIHYCGGGIAATTSAFVLALLGHSDWTVYDDSLLQWSNESDTPMVSG
jgi:thiosulfate/3-mercaptopyruvate sulfurtransferase